MKVIVFINHFYSFQSLATVLLLVYMQMATLKGIFQLFPYSIL